VVGERNRQLHADIEDVLIEKYEIPKEAKSVSAGLDRVSIPMEEEVPRPPGRPPKDAPKKSIARNFRMAYVGTITLHDAEGEALHTIRYGTMPQGDVGALCESLGGDIAALLSKRPELKVAALVDGAPEMRNLLRTEITEGALGTPVRELVDFWHTAEKLGKAATVIYGSEGEAKANFKRWRFALLNRDGAAESILDELRQSGHEQTWYGGTQPVHEAITYLNNNLDRMAYARARREGLPIGSGNTEATCKSLFEIRMKRSGSRWKEETGEHVVGLRALALSNRWDDAITLTLRDLRAAVRRAA